MTLVERVVHKQRAVILLYHIRNGLNRPESMQKSCIVSACSLEKLCVSSCYFFDGARAGMLNLRRGERTCMSAFSV